MGDVDIDRTPRQGRIVSHTPLYVWAYPCEHSGRAVQPVVDVLGIAGWNTLNDRFNHIRAVGRVINAIAGQVVGTAAGRDYLDERIGADFDQEWFVQEAFRQKEVVVVVDGDGQCRSVGRAVNPAIFGVMIHARGLDGVIADERIADAGVVDGFEDLGD